MKLTDADHIAIRNVIGQQLQAFQDDDEEKAFSFASPAIQAQFRTAEQFIDMVKSAYPPVYRPRSVVFESLTLIEGKIAQPVFLMGTDGELYMALYMMQSHVEHRWRIEGCFLSKVKAQAKE